MTSNTFRYSAKVWLTSVAIAPLLFLIVTYYPEAESSNNLQQAISGGFFFYIFFAFIELIFSLITWLVFMACIQLIITLLSNHRLRLLAIAITGVALTIISFHLVLSSGGIFTVKEDIEITSFNCVCIVGGVWFYRLNPDEPELTKPVPPEPQKNNKSNCDEY